jgi:hypothetical protein
MFLKALAKDLYKSQKEVEALEQKVVKSASVSEQEQLREQILQTKAELAQLKKILEGKKEQSRVSQQKTRAGKW